jgi:hypothetical protein
MTKLTFTKLRENLCNVGIHGRDTHWYVEKKGSWYEIQWGNLDELLSFREQSWFSSQSKEEIMEKLQECTRHKVEIRRNRQGIKYVYQDTDQDCSTAYRMAEQRRLAQGKR